MAQNGNFIEYTALETDASGDGTQDVNIAGILASIDIVPDDSSSFDITINRVLPDGTLSSDVYTATGVTALTAVSKSDLTPNPCVLAGTVRITLANAGEHASAAKVYLTIV